jgi:hypothetical protein
MSLHNLTNTEIAARLAQSLKAWRISPQGAAMSQVELARKSGIGLTPLRRFEKTGAITFQSRGDHARAGSFRPLRRSCSRA